MRYVPIPMQRDSDVSRLAAALYSMVMHADSTPEWMKGAAREMCRDFHVTMSTIQDKPLVAS